MMQIIRSKKKIINYVIFFINILFAGFYVWALFPVTQYFLQEKELNEIGMQTYVKQKPFTILVDKTEPEISKFLLALDGTSILFCYDARSDLIEAKICVGAQNGVSVSFTKGLNPEIRRVTLTNKNKYMIDEGGDGVYDQQFRFGTSCARLSGSGSGNRLADSAMY